MRHGKGERVLPAGLDLASAVEAKKYLQKAGFAIPDQDGGAAAHLWTEPEDKERSYSVTHLELPLVVLPEKPGRNVMTLPPLPVAVARANGEIATVCTHPHPIGVEDPTANAPQAEPKPNPPPRPQREEWTALEEGAPLGWPRPPRRRAARVPRLQARSRSRSRRSRRRRPAPPWEVALERLDEVRHAGLLDAQRHAEYFDRVSDAVRGYLGARFGFDGLESTSDEILTALKKHAGGFVRLDAASELNAPAPGIPLDEVRQFLAECDLVKFAQPEAVAGAVRDGAHRRRAHRPLDDAVLRARRDASEAPAPAPAPVAAPRAVDDSADAAKPRRRPCRRLRDDATHGGDA